MSAAATPPTTTTATARGGKTAVMYARVASTSPSDMARLHEQQRICARLAARHGAHLTTAFIDIGGEGKPGRPELDRLLTHLASHRTDLVVCASKDRLTRNRLTYQTLTKHIAALGSHLVFADNPVDPATIHLLALSAPAEMPNTLQKGNKS